MNNDRKDPRMKNDQEEAYEKVLSSTLARVIDFVKFAEAKNAALLTFASAWILASINFMYGASKISDPHLIWAFNWALPLFTIGAIISFVTFLPEISLDQFHKDPEKRKSLLFFGDAATFSPAIYKERLEEFYLPGDGHWATQKYLEDLSIQINVNSKIAVKKFRFFKVAACSVFSAIVLLLYPFGKTFFVSYFLSK